MSTPSKRSLRPPVKHRSGYAPNAPEEVWNRYIENAGGCWIYTYAKDRYGYGQFRYHGYNGHRAHVVAWILTNGDIDSGLVIDHTCAERSCINPSHMRLLTPEENTIDGTRRRSVPIECIRGHREYSTGKNRRCMECDRERHRGKKSE